jgi:O-antigen/teichoic acid export membrane protein
MTSLKRITFNTIATYSRSLISAGFTLFSSRWVIKALGVSDFGLFSLVGSIIVFITFFNGIMSTSSSRHFSYELGRELEGEINKWFNSALSIHLILPFCILVLGYPIGVFLIENIFNLPSDKINDAIIIFRISSITAFVSMLSVPFNAMYIAKQKFVELALFGILQSFLTFVSALILLKVSGNKLIIHATLISGVFITIYLIQIVRAIIYFPECKIITTEWFQKQRIIELSSFAFWNLLGNFGHLMRSQGLALLTNMFFGTKGNAAFGVSNQLANQTSRMTNSLSSSISPEIIKIEGQGESKRAIEISFQGTKFGIYLILLLTIPLLTETNYVLNLWLTTVPPNTVVLCQLMIVVFMLEKTTMSHFSLLQAVNKIAKPQISMGITFTLTVAIAYFLIQFDLGIQSIGWAVVISMGISRIILAYWVKKYLGISFQYWLNKIILPYFFLTVIALFFSYFLTTFLDPSLLRLFLNVIGNILLTTILCWLVFFSKQEKSLALNKFNELINRTRKNG